MKVLVVAAHPDDEVLGCGAAIAAHSQSGDVVEILILGEGLTSRLNSREEVAALELNRLQDNARAAAAILGARAPRFGGLPDNRFDSVPLLEIVKLTERVIRDVDPEAIYTHHSSDLNVDHRLTFYACLTATRPFGSSVRDLYSFEIPSSTEWSFQSIEPSFRPNRFLNAEHTIEQKIRALAVYESEIRTFPHPRSAEAVMSYAKRWGTVAGVPAAEAFQIIRSIR
jgi:LmbE family N-acetylglucosaminyl deacetylase